MTIFKLSASGKQFQVVDDFGNVYGSPKTSIMMLLSGDINSGFVKMSRLPFRVSQDRFGPSDLWNPDNLDIPLINAGIDTSNDALSQLVLKDKEVVKSIEDKEVW